MDNFVGSISTPEEGSKTNANQGIFFNNTISYVPTVPKIHTPKSKIVSKIIDSDLIHKAMQK